MAEVARVAEVPEVAGERPKTKHLIQHSREPIHYPFLILCTLTQKILSRATFSGAPSYGGMRTCVECSQTHGSRALAEASNLLAY